jgi:hypothetical protein
MSKYPFAYPVIGFARTPYWRRHGYKGEFLQAFPDEASITQCRQTYIETADLTDMLLVDSNGRAWETTKVWFEGPLGPWWKRIWPKLLGTQDFLVHLEIAETEPVSLEAVKARVIAAIDADPEMHIDEELVVGEAGPPQDPEVLIADLKAKVMASRDNREIIKVVEIIDELS